MATSGDTTDSIACAVCGKPHPRTETEIFFKRPDPYLEVAESERRDRTKADDDLCVIDKSRFFVRGILPIPVTDGQQDYCWGVWAEVSEADFRRILQLWSAPEQASEPPIEARLANEIPYYGGTFGLRAELRLTGPKTRPRLDLVDEHPRLSKQQRDGVDRSELSMFWHARAELNKYRRHHAAVEPEC